MANLGKQQKSRESYPVKGFKAVYIIPKGCLIFITEQWSWRLWMSKKKNCTENLELSLKHSFVHMVIPHFKNDDSSQSNIRE